tara:strand:- start:413 stop:2500 length:2088 start_codon:yes stop_codon:yes gene_type:complete
MNCIKQVVTIVISLIVLSESHAQKHTVKTKVEIEKIVSNTIASHDTSGFINFLTEEAQDEHFISLGKVSGFKRYSAAFRNKSCWMIPSIGDEIEAIPIETQFLLIDRGNSEYLMMIPLVDAKTRCSLNGTKEGELQLIAETGDRLTKVNQFLGLYLLSGSNPQQMIKKASAEIQHELKTFKLRNEKADPWFADYFGWCTWNALSTKLSADALMYAVDNFKQKEIPVKYMIIDAGWQSNTNDYMNSYDGDKKKFPNGLAPVISEMKDNSTIEKVFAWQALWGTFKGLDAEAFSHISTPVHCELPPRMQKSAKASSEDVQQVATVGKEFYPGKAGRDIMVPDFVPYMEEYSDYLRRQGVDGIKIDAMTWVESTGNGRGGRVAAMKDMMQGVQAAANTHFNNEMINCSSCSNDYLFNTLSSNVTRSSGDFFPDKPETHGAHIFINAHTSFWMGEIILPDWDMFQSGHSAGDFHAAARAISGGPIYTTEKIGTENKQVLDRLMTSYGKLPRCKDVGRVCTESLFTDPENDKGLLKIYNTNIVGGIVGAFNCSYNPKKSVSIQDVVAASDIEGLQGNNFAVYRYSNGELSVQNTRTVNKLKIKELEYDLFTYIPIQDGFAPVGIIEKYNPAGMIINFQKVSTNIHTIDLMDGGTFIAFAEEEPHQVLLDAKPINFDYHKKSKKILITVPLGKESRLTIIQ